MGEDHTLTATNAVGSATPQTLTINVTNWMGDVVYLGDLAIAEITPSGIHELHCDHLGTPIVITSGTRDANGNIGRVEGQQYFGPYGEQLLSSSGYTPMTGFTGHLQTEPNGLIYMRGRFYSPTWHRFLNSDQGADPGQLNQFAYCGGSPMKGVDPSGLTTFYPGSGGGNGGGGSGGSQGGGGSDDLGSIPQSWFPGQTHICSIYADYGSISSTSMVRLCDGVIPYGGANPWDCPIGFAAPWEFRSQTGQGGAQGCSPTDGGVQSGGSSGSSGSGSSGYSSTSSYYPGGAIVTVEDSFELVSTGGGLPSSGWASTYANSLSGCRTANGEIYDPKKYTAALLPKARWGAVPYGTIVLITYGDRTVAVEINDCGPGNGSMDRVLDLSRATMAYLLGVSIDSSAARTIIYLNNIQVAPSNTPLGPISNTF